MTTKKTFAAKVAGAAVRVDASQESTSPAKKDPYDKTSSERSRRLNAEIKKDGGGTVILRLRGELMQLDALVTHGVGSDRNDVLRKLIREKYEKIVEVANK